MHKEDAQQLLNSRSGAKWKRIGTARRAGMLVPLFSVYSRSSIGLGDFGDLMLLSDICARAGMSILQLLPMNEIGSTFCPYDSISAFALEPSYISLKGIPNLKIGRVKKAFPCGKGRVDYDIKAEKERILWGYYSKLPEGHGGDFDKFVEDNSYWIEDFALYKVIKAHQGLKPWYEWDIPLRDRDTAALAEFRKAHRKEFLFQKWVQWNAYSQFTRAKDYAASKGILLKGDLPILMSRDSSDVWAHRGYFKLDLAAGAPPDMYCAKGQRWGMPTYDWDSISKDGHRYLKEKLKFAENFYDILRVDHVVGLFRIWSIPYGDPPENEGTGGFFDPRDERFWGAHGSEILEVMNNATSMLLCAEDLGMIPRSCPETLKDFGIPGNDVQRWTKDWTKRHDFLTPEEYRLLSVAMLSTHDTTNWNAWWENEAGTVDAAMFERKCRERGIDHQAAYSRLFDTARSRHGRLRWNEDIKSADKLVEILGRRREELVDFVEIYENTYKEKERLWNMMGLEGKMQELASPYILEAALRMTASSRSVFCIELITDIMNLSGILGEDFYDYRINRPGTIGRDNWSLVMPISLNDLLKHKLLKKVKGLLSSR